MTASWDWKRSESGAVLAVHGDFDVAVGGEFVKAIDEGLTAEAAPDQVVIDLAGVEFIDSSGLRALLQVQESYGERVQLGEVSAAVQRLLELTGTLGHFRLGGPDADN